jgi:hypothetical protein
MVKMKKLFRGLYENGKVLITAHKSGEVSYHDPFITQVKTNEGRKISSVDLSAGPWRWLIV